VDDVRGGHRPRAGVVRGQPVPPAAPGDARVRPGPGWRLGPAHARAARGPRRAAARASGSASRAGCCRSA
jgi:hypothetical protein